MKSNLEQISEEVHDNYRWTEQLCPICEIKPTKFLGTRGGAAHRSDLGVEAQIWACEKCSLIFPNPMPYPINGLGQHYDVDTEEYFEIHDLEKRQEQHLRMVKQTERLLGRKGKLVDVGVGRGDLLNTFKQSGWEVEGIEPSESFADYVEKNVGIKIWRQPVEKCDIPEDTFDVVILAAVLEHLYNPDEVIAKISRILKSGGLLFLDVPNEVGLYFKVGNIYQKVRGRDWSVNLSPTFPPYHVFGFTPKSLRLLLAKHNLTPKDWKVYGGASAVPTGEGIFKKLESQASKLVTAISEMGEMGTYIETWAIKN